METAVIYLLVGAAIALLGDFVRYKYTIAARVRGFKATALVELQQLEARMLIVHQSIVLRFGKYDKEFLRWMKENAFRTTAVLPDNDETKEVIKLIEGLNLEQVTDDQLGQMISAHRATKKDSLTQGKYDLPLVQSRLELLEQCGVEFAHGVFDILTHLAFYNQSVEDWSWNFRKTFDSSISEGNRKIIGENIKGLYTKISESSKRIADLIRALVDGQS